MAYGDKQASLQYETLLRTKTPARITGDVSLHTQDGYAFATLEGVAPMPFSPATSKNDLPMFTQLQRKVATPDGGFAAAEDTLSAFEAQQDPLHTGPNSHWISRLVCQIAHRFPALNILEVGAGHGATIASILGALDGVYASYTFADTSKGLFAAAEEQFAEQSARMAFKSLNWEQDPSAQRFLRAHTMSSSRHMYFISQLM
ncbi:hypothetical protein S7711_08487 [Stachybotrys chartarum IBT 7711]|uniref:Uncharacterized protein n=1 Tax=Stachybotrys chartarum (strain CBS 109288 / IBT 7711) TaxID=1280523 RepID=A0A084BCN7_STACB|nr:hypothetical protein S7711_08487 [Stachybotrys chartarum IBT 7711]KFA52976.1 hypothetical protein S40293_09155 [Stachybotrys chartarum IBT 40293]